jgi:divalent metal cation (Fe/Co/Zn/Cd) transporter
MSDVARTVGTRAQLLSRGLRLEYLTVGWNVVEAVVAVAAAVAARSVALLRWWADPVAALIIPVFLLREAREAWKGEDGD